LIGEQQWKRRRYRQVMLNSMVSRISQTFSKGWGDRPVTQSNGDRLGVPMMSRKVKAWCMDIRLNGNYRSHTLRKTWGFWPYKRGTSIPLLIEALRHQTQRQIMAYLCIQMKDVAQIFEMEL
jgi:integrase